MSITYTIPGVPLLDQLNEPTADHQSDENKRDNCVFATNAALATAYLGAPFYGDQLKDANPHYGQGYVGFASEAFMVQQMAGLGITITREPSATQRGLLDILHAEIPKGHGVIITMPSDWNSALTNPVYQPWNPRTYRGPSHVGLACGVGNGFIRVMNPWGGFWHDGTDAYWSARLLRGEVWVGVHTGVIDVATSTLVVPTGWKDDPASEALTAPNGVAAVHGMRYAILTWPGGWDAKDMPLAEEYPTPTGRRLDCTYSGLDWNRTTNAVAAAPIGQDYRNALAALTSAAQHITLLTNQLNASSADSAAIRALAARIAAHAGGN